MFNTKWQIQQMTPDTKIVQRVQHGQIKRSCTVKHAVTTIILVLCLAAPLAAGQLEDAAQGNHLGEYRLVGWR